MQNFTFDLPDWFVDQIKKYGWQEGTKGSYLEFKIEIKQSEKKDEIVEPEYIHNMSERDPILSDFDQIECLNTLIPIKYHMLPESLIKEIKIENKSACNNCLSCVDEYFLKNGCYPNEQKKKSGRPRKYPKKDPDAPKKKSGRPKVLSDEEVKQNKKEYAKKYQQKRYKKDEYYRSERIHHALKYYYNKHPQEIKTCDHDDK